MSFMATGQFKMLAAVHHATMDANRTYDRAVSELLSTISSPIEDSDRGRVKMQVRIISGAMSYIREGLDKTQKVLDELTGYMSGQTASLREASEHYTLTRDIRTKGGEEFKSGESLKVNEWLDRKSVWLVHLLADDGRSLKVPLVIAYKYLRGFPKPPSEATMQRWMEDSRAKAVDGATVEPDGHSPSGAPSWILVLGFI